MGYDIELIEDGEPVCVEPHSVGSILVVGGNDRAEMTITYNYSDQFKALDEAERLDWLNGKSGAETIERLERAVVTLGTEVHRGPYYVLKLEYAEASNEWIERLGNVDFEAPENAELFAEALKLGVIYNTGGYWKSTPGNAGHVLNILLSWAKQCPNACWRIS